MFGIKLKEIQFQTWKEGDIHSRFRENIRTWCFCNCIIGALVLLYYIGYILSMYRRNVRIVLLQLHNWGFNFNFYNKLFCICNISLYYYKCNKLYFMWMVSSKQTFNSTDIIHKTHTNIINNFTQLY